MTYELPWDTGPEEVINVLYSAMVGMTFRSEDILDTMKQFVEDHTEKIDEGNYEEV